MVVSRVLLVTVLFYCLSTNATEQRIGDFEIAIDAPWRMEPHKRGLTNCGVNCNSSSAYRYGAIPINIAILDAFLPDEPNDFMLQRALQGHERGDISTVKTIKELFDPRDDLFSEYPNIVLRRFESLVVSEKIAGRFVKRSEYTINDLHEIEKTNGAWQWSANSANPPPRPTRQLCRRWQGSDCRSTANLQGTSEWHAIGLYTPASKKPGSDVILKLDLKLTTGQGNQVERKTFTQYVNVHLGESPMPRFDSNWYYGDIHYHSQGTDNDGESGYSYRSALQAMGAIGLDFAFATDHASNSRQIVTLSKDNLGEVFGPNVLRDLSPDRFAHNIGIVNGADGANREVASYPRNAVNGLIPNANLGINNAKRNLFVPQIFLGAEVDVIPEFEEGKNSHFQFQRACEDLPLFLKRLEIGGGLKALLGGIGDFIDVSDPNPNICGNDNMTTAAGDGRLLIRDVQGPFGSHLLSRNFFGRQHMLHLPQQANRTDSFIASNTSLYGGATRRLKDILSTEFRQPNGIVFLAHPNNTPSGSDFGRIGPDIAPFAEAPLLDAFRSENVLGLQLWNEDNHFKTTMGKGDAINSRPDENDGFKGELIPVADLSNWRHEKEQKFSVSGLSMWDSMLMWGIDPAITKTVDWLPEGEPRRVFIAGGSDAHGDYNYRREGYFVGITDIADGAIGKPRNLLFAGTPQGQPISSGQKIGTPVSQPQIVQAFREGNFIVTDGPIIRLAYDANKNGKIDANDIPMGGVATVNQCGFPLLVEWKSTPEFGKVKSIDLKIGVFSDQHADGWVYQPWHPNPSQPEKKPSDFYFNTFTDADTGKTLTKSELSSPLGWRGKNREHFFDPSTDSIMTINISSAKGYAGVKRVEIEPEQFPVATLSTKNICLTQFKTNNKKRPFVKKQPVEKLLVESRKSKIRTIKRQVNPNGVGGGLTQVGDTGVVLPTPNPTPPIDPNCIVRNFTNSATPDRMYIRAELKGKLNGKLPLKAYSNPIWFKIKSSRIQQCRFKAPTDHGSQNAPKETPKKPSASNCSASDSKLCSSNGASCDVIKTNRGRDNNICRWNAINTKKKCDRTVGIWTSVRSKYARNHPGAVPLGDSGACITDVTNIKKRIN